MKLNIPLNPGNVFLFSGHMIDAPDRSEPRFPAEMEGIAAKAINCQLDALGAGPGDLGLCGGACGGDLLFAEACLACGIAMEIRIPFAVPKFLEKSVAFAGSDWVERFYKVIENLKVQLLVMPEELGALPQGSDPYERDNLWQLESALSFGPEKVRFLCLWNGKGGDGPGGTRHMVKSVKQRSGKVYILDTNTLW
jgi:hypothetical protein